MWKASEHNYQYTTKIAKEQLDQYFSTPMYPITMLMVQNKENSFLCLLLLIKITSLVCNCKKKSWWARTWTRFLHLMHTSICICYFLLSLPIVAYDTLCSLANVTLLLVLLLIVMFVCLLLLLLLSFLKSNRSCNLNQCCQSVTWFVGTIAWLWSTAWSSIWFV